MILLLLLVQVTAETKDEKTWRVSGKVESADETMIVAARRIERRWDPKSRDFTEMLSDEVRVRATAVIEKGRFDVTLKAGPTGLYELSVGDRPSSRAGFGSVAALFARMRGSVKTATDLAKAAIDFIDEVEAAMKDEGKRPADYDKRIAAREESIAKLKTETDFTATLAALGEIYFQLRNAQFASAKRAKAAENDGEVLLDPELTLGGLRERAKSIPTILSLEARASIRSLLDAKSRAEALKLAEEVPEPDKKLIAELEK